MDDNNLPETERLISSFTEITSSSREVAISFLETHQWNLDAAVSTFSKNNEVAEPNVPNTSDEHLLRRNQTPYSNLRIDIPSPSHDSSDYSPLRVRFRSPSPSRQYGFNETPENYGGEDNRDIERPEQSSRSMSAETEAAELQEETQPVFTYTVTSWRNGFTINNRPLNTLDDPENVACLEAISRLESPRELGQFCFQVKLIRREQEYFTESSQAPLPGVERTLAGSDSASTESPALAASPSMRATESAIERPEQSPRLVSEETVTADLQEQQQQDQPYLVVTFTVTIWKNGFTVNDGPLKSLDDPINADYLERITRLESPRLLGPVSIQIKLIRREENFSESPPVQGVAESDSVCTEPAASPSSSMGLVVVDLAAPTTSIQVRLADGIRIVTELNTHHTVRDVRGFIDACRPDDPKDYQLLSMGFPPTPLSDFNQTIEEAGIANSVLIQKF